MNLLLRFLALSQQGKMNYGRRARPTAMYSRCERSAAIGLTISAPTSLNCYPAE